MHQMWKMYGLSWYAHYYVSLDDVFMQAVSTWIFRQVDTSRYYFNYRHSSDVMGFYQNLRDSGIPDSQVSRLLMPWWRRFFPFFPVKYEELTDWCVQIIVLLADDASCNPRNPFAGQMYINSRYTHNLYA